MHMYNTWHLAVLTSAKKNTHIVDFNLSLIYYINKYILTYVSASYYEKGIWSTSKNFPKVYFKNEEKHWTVGNWELKKLQNNKNLNEYKQWWPVRVQGT